MYSTYEKHKKTIYVASGVLSLCLDAAILTLPETSWQEKLAYHSTIVFFAQLTFMLINDLDRVSTVEALTKNPNVTESHPEFEKLHTLRDPDAISELLNQSNPEILRLTHPTTLKAKVFRERDVMYLLFLLPVLVTALLPEKIKAIQTNRKHASQGQKYLND